MISIALSVSFIRSARNVRNNTGRSCSNFALAFNVGAVGVFTPFL